MTRCGMLGSADQRAPRSPHESAGGRVGHIARSGDEDALAVVAEERGVTREFGHVDREAAISDEVRGEVLAELLDEVDGRAAVGRPDVEHGRLVGAEVFGQDAVRGGVATAAVILNVDPTWKAAIAAEYSSGSGRFVRTTRGSASQGNQLRSRMARGHSRPAGFTGARIAGKYTTRWMGP